MKTNIEDLEGIGIERDLAGYPTLYLPLEIMERDTEEAEKTYQTYLDLVANVRRDKAEGLLLPSVFDDHGNRVYEFKLLSSSGSRQFDTSRIITRYDARIALTIMADFLLLGQQRQGSYALSETKARMFYQAITAVLDNIAETINSQAVPALFELNPWWDLDELPYLAHGKVEIPNLQLLGEFIERMARAGMKLFPDDRLEDHLRGLADLPLKGSEGEPRGEARPAFSEQDRAQGAKPDMEEDGAEEGEGGDEMAEEEEVPA
jgi:phage gp29-like protein